ncbi:MAG: membrane protein insertion efficiency factor YidD [Waddliaceae bacterium]|nr:membrane protein insertion efficiency factor YidD [Waddliaceae bacterium]
MKNTLCYLVRFYQIAISPFIGSCCRFSPSCSHYCIQAIQKHGSIKGSYLTIKRLFKCHPWHPGGIDPV